MTKITNCEYDYEVNRRFNTAKEFFDFVRLDFWLATGHNLNEWIENFREFINPEKHYNILIGSPWFERKLIAYKTYRKTEYYMRGVYEFRMEYKDGKGYCIARKRKGVTEKKLKKISKNFKKVLDKAKRI